MICEAKNDLVFSETNPKTFAQNIVANCAEGQGRGASIVFKREREGLCQVKQAKYKCDKYTPNTDANICPKSNTAHTPIEIQFTTSSRRLDGGAYCGAPVGGKCMVSKAKLVLYAFAV